MSKKIFISRKIPEIAVKTLQDSNQDIEVTVWNGAAPPTKKELIENAKYCTGILTMLSDQVDREVIDSCPKLKVISNYAVGINNIDTAYAKTKGIKVGNTPDVLTDATAELAFTLMLAVSRNIKQGISDVTNNRWRQWEPIGYLGPSLRGKKLGIIGMGRIGIEMARRSHFGLNMEISYYSRSTNKKAEEELSATNLTLENLLKTSDVISIHTPLTDETRNLIGKKRLSLMKKTAILINSSRGEIIDQDGLYDALKSSSIFGAGLDVTTPEPLPDTHPLVGLDNCLITPHIGSGTFTARDDMAVLAAKNLL